MLRRHFAASLAALAASVFAPAPSLFGRASPKPPALAPDPLPPCPPKGAVVCVLDVGEQLSQREFDAFLAVWESRGWRPIELVESRALLRYLRSRPPM